MTHIYLTISEHDVEAAKAPGWASAPQGQTCPVAQAAKRTFGTWDVSAGVRFLRLGWKRRRYDYSQPLCSQVGRFDRDDEFSPGRYRLTRED